MNTKQFFISYLEENPTCEACGTTNRPTIDHIVPQSKGGGDEPENIRTLCHSCNSSKQDRDNDWWWAYRANRPRPTVLEVMEILWGDR